MYHQYLTRLMASRLKRYGMTLGELRYTISLFFGRASEVTTLWRYPNLFIIIINRKFRTVVSTSSPVSTLAIEPAA